LWLCVLSWLHVEDAVSKKKKVYLDSHNHKLNQEYNNYIFDFQLMIMTVQGLNWGSYVDY